MTRTAETLVITNPSERLLTIAREIRQRKREQLAEAGQVNSTLNIVL